MSQKIAFFLPDASGSPTGGARIAYTYANFLASEGHDVTVWHFSHPSGGKDSFSLKRFIIYLVKKMINFTPKWFTFKREIKFRIGFYIKESYVSQYDKIVLTSWDTAFALYGSASDRQKLFYLVQGFEDWATSEENLIKSYSVTDNIAVVSSYLSDRLNRLGFESRCIFNPADNDIFPRGEKRDYALTILLHPSEFKGTQESITISNRVKEVFPDIKVAAYGTHDTETPKYIEKHIKPSRTELNGILNKTKIYLYCSSKEGWGLAPFEAMQAGCICLLKDLEGYKDFASNGENCLMFHNTDEAIEIIKQVLTEYSYYAGIGYKASKISEIFSPDQSYQKFKDFLRLL